MPAAMSGLIGYYVHHQGDGHRHRAVAVAGHAPGRFVLLGTGLIDRCRDGRYIEMNDDRPGPCTESPAVTPTGALHYAPVGYEGIRRRVASMAAWIASARPALIMVDVSVEIAMLARLMSTRFAYMRLGGERTDAAHLEAFRAAQMLVAPFHEDLDAPGVPQWVRKKTRYVPGLTNARIDPAPSSDVVLVANGNGGGTMDGAAIAAAATLTPGLRWRVIGPCMRPASHPPNLVFLGWVSDAEREIAAAGVVIGSAGDGIASAVFATGRPYICLPQERPYEEQVSRARRMDELGAAIVLEHAPPAAEWPGLLQSALRLDPAAAARLHGPQGTRRLAELLQQLADGDECRPR
jgi:hypothetical protein